VRVWDLPTGRCVDWIKFDRPATSLDLSPASDMLATADVGDLGIYLWTNKTMYDRVALRPVREKAGPRPLGLPGHLLVTEGLQEAGGMEVVK
jgi:U3 small nucleolar RNA-associated protein 21